jgi:hypothetical protein
MVRTSFVTWYASGVWDCRQESRRLVFRSFRSVASTSDLKKKLNCGKMHIKLTILTVLGMQLSSVCFHFAVQRPELSIL